MSSLRDKSFSAEGREQERKLTIDSPRPLIIFSCVPAGKISEGISPGSLTVEAALVLTLFLMAAICFLGIEPAMQVGLEIQAAAEEAGEEMAAAFGVVALFKGGEDHGEALSGSGVEAWITGGVTLAVLKERVIGKIGRERLEQSCVSGGSGGLSFLGSSWMEDGDWIEIRVSYRIRLPISFGNLMEIPVTQICRRRAWTGNLAEDGGSGEEEELVYVTENGTVYHCSMECTHLNLSIREVAFGSVDGRRNEAGGRYRPCERCAKYSDTPAIVWITQEGNRYHTDRECGGLKRNVQTKRKSEVTLPPCRRCGGGS